MAIVAVQALIALLACLCLLTHGFPRQFDVAKNPRRLFYVPDGKVHVYNYSAEVRSAQNEPSPYASKLQIRGKLIHKQNINDPDFKFVDYLKFHDVEHTIYNGPDDGKVHGDYKPLDSAIQDFDKPILLIYDSFNNLQGFKIQEKEALWSKNIKMALISLMQIHVQDSLETLKEHMTSTSYQIPEKTIHGDCQVSYTFYHEVQDNKKIYYLRKNYEPKSCTNFIKYTVSDVKILNCKTQSEDDLVTTAEKIYEFELVNDNFLLTKIHSHEKLSYLPYLHRSAGIQYIETSQIFELNEVINESEISLPYVNFKSVPMVDEINFNAHNYITQHQNNYGKSMKTSDAIEKVTKLLILMVDYLRENHIDTEKLQEEQKDLLLDLYHIIGSLDSKSMYSIYKHFDSGTEKENMIRKFFLEMVPHTGSFAAWNFTKIMILNNDYPNEDTVIDMLASLPMFVIDPNEELVMSMQPFRNFHKLTVSTKIIHAGVLCYSILLHKTYKHIGKNLPEFLKNELDHFFERIKREPTYEAKIVYIMALRNVEVESYYYLHSLISGVDIFEVKTDAVENIEKYRNAAMWAAANSIYDSESFWQNNQFWRILSNSSETLPLRLTAYELLIPRNPKLDINLLMKVYWMMTKEHDEHLFNYHYTTMKHMSESTDPCNKDLSESMRKVFRLTQRRRVLSPELSSVNVFEYFDDRFGYGKSFKIAAGINEASGMPHYGYYEAITTFLKSRSDNAIYWNIDGINLNMILSLVENPLQQESDKTPAPYEITDEKVRNLLKQTYGHKLLDKHIHIEFWTINKGYVTNVDVLAEKGLSDYLKEYVSSYKPRNFMDVKDKYSMVWLDVFFLNQHKTIFATDVGIPAFFYKEFPTLSYIKLKPNIYPIQTIISMKLDFEAKMYHHGMYKMKFYNPLADILHSVRRNLRVYVDFPIDLTISLNIKTYNWKLVLPRLPKTKFSVTGIKVHTTDQVKISKDFSDILQSYCSSCKHQMEITKGPSYKTNYINALHSKEIGLMCEYSIYDCENYRSLTNEYEEIFRVFRAKENSVDNDEWPTFGLKMHHQLFNFIYAPHVNTCGKIIKISPSTIYPTSHIEINCRIYKKKFNDKMNIKIEGSIETKAALENNTGFYWDINFDANVSMFLNDVKLQLLKKSAEEKSYKVCLVARKEYPNFSLDLASVKQETNTEIILNAGYTDSKSCLFDDSHTNITVAIKGELLDEQVEEMINNIKPGSCFRNRNNFLDLDVNRYIDWNCLYEVVKSTTMRKYTVDVTYNNISQETLTKLVIFGDYLRHDYMPYLSYKSNHTEAGNLKIVATYSTNSNHGNLTVISPYLTYEFNDIQYGPEDPEDRRTDLVLDNIGFSTNFLVDYYKGKIRPCIAHAKDVITDLNHTLPMEFEKWTLLSGDHELMTYAIFVKAIQNKVAVKIYASMHILEIQPGNMKPIITFDGTEIENFKEELILLPIGSEAQAHFKLRMINELLLVEIEKFSKVKVFYTLYNIIILPQIILNRNVDGICGHMGQTYVQQTSLIYNS